MKNLMVALALAVASLGCRRLGKTARFRRQTSVETPRYASVSRLLKNALKWPFDRELAK